MIIAYPSYCPCQGYTNCLKECAGYYTGKIDGKIGPKTNSAIKALSKVMSLLLAAIAVMMIRKGIFQFLN